MYHYDPKVALDELNDEAVLPNPVHLRDMLLRAKLNPEHSLELNRKFLEYQKEFGDASNRLREILEALK